MFNTWWSILSFCEVFAPIRFLVFYPNRVDDPKTSPMALKHIERHKTTPGSMSSSSKAYLFINSLFVYR